MAILGWLVIHWFELLQTTSIVVGLYATVHALRDDTRERKIENLFTITKSHRDLWTALYSNPELVRVIRQQVDLEKLPITAQEGVFVHLLILHLRASFKARTAGMEFSDDALPADVHWFFSRPIPRLVWERSKAFQDAAFVNFVESCLEESVSSDGAN